MMIEFVLIAVLCLIATFLLLRKKKKKAAVVCFLLAVGNLLFSMYMRYLMSL